MLPNNCKCEYCVKLWKNHLIQKNHIREEFDQNILQRKSLNFEKFTETHKNRVNERKKR